MRQTEFERRYAPEWEQFEHWLKAQEGGRRVADKMRAKLPGEAWIASAEVPARYRSLCSHLALARERGYGPTLIEKLHQWVLRGHHRLYAASAPDRSGFWHFLSSGFPAAVRREWRVVCLATALFFVPGIGLYVAIQIWPDFAHVVLSAEQRVEAEMMYASSNERLGEEDGSSRFQMFGFYVWNNVRIGFQTFAGGVLFGLGSVFFLLLNGVFIGSFIGYVAEIGLTEEIFSFVAGHSAPELLAIALSGAAGLKLGAALISPGRRSRALALTEDGAKAFQLAGGAGLMFLAAAFVEAFWSPLQITPVAIKYAVGIALWVLLGLYFALVGRHTSGPWRNTGGTRDDQASDGA